MIDAGLDPFVDFTCGVSALKPAEVVKEIFSLMLSFSKSDLLRCQRGQGGRKA
jgi:hypothetical protein